MYIDLYGDKLKMRFMREGQSCEVKEYHCMTLWWVEKVYLYVIPDT